MTSGNPAPEVADETADPRGVADHYARSGLIAAIENGLRKAGKPVDAVTIDDLAAVDEFHIGGRKATADLMEQLAIAPDCHVLDVGCGLGGPARFVASSYGCQVSGIDLTPDYVEAGNRLCEWVGLNNRVRLQRASALAMPFQPSAFGAAYMLHVGMNIEDKEGLCREVARVLQPGSRFAVYDVMRTGDGELAFPVPWATTAETSQVNSPQAYKDALRGAGFEVLSERNRKEFALGYFADQKARAAVAGDPAPLGLHTLMGDRRQAQIQNMIASISKGIIAPVELIAQKTG